MDQNAIRLYVDDRPDEGVFRVHGNAFTDPQLFELEMKYIFERTWSFLTLESAIAKPNDFVTTHIGRTPVVVTRDAKGAVHAHVNACRHKGATVARLEQGNARYHVCPYHGWAYDASGRNVDIKDRAAGCYAEAFDAENHDLLPIARVASYNGMLFGSLSADVPPLEDYLGDFRFFIDLLMEQGPQGMEIVPGRMAYTYRGNWKLQMENPLDTYHVDTTHASYLIAAKQRAQAEQKRAEQKLEVKRIDYGDRTLGECGVFGFRHGHSIFWRTIDNPQKRPIWPELGEIRSRVGDTKADWMLPLRNGALFPSLLVLDTVVPHLRFIRPIATNLTEVRTYSLAPIGEKPELRAWRMRQLEDFLNPAGFATPDDLVLFDECQSGFEGVKGLGVKGKAADLWLQGYSRGMAASGDSAADTAQRLGIRPAGGALGATNMGNEAILHGYWREWVRLMQAGLAANPPYAST